MQASEIRKRYLDFFARRGHAIVPSASLIPENDPTTLFTGSGMQPMMPFLLGAPHPKGARIADSQKSFRAGDIEEVGDNRHTTFFEMLGNWSLGDYFKKEQLPWIFEFLTEEIGLDPARLYVTVFIGDDRYGFPKDDESVAVWKELFAGKGIDAKDVAIGSESDGYEKGMQGGRIFYYDATKNWWSRAGVPENMPVGEPGGPDSEIFYDFGTPHDPAYGKECHPNCDCGRFLEIGNSVFMQYLKQPDGSFAPLSQKNVDFGGGLERITMAASNDSDVIAVNHRPIVGHLERVSGKTYGANEQETRAFRIVADHMKASVFLIADGARPSNTDQGYFVRRLIRRSVHYADSLGIKENGLGGIVVPIAEMYRHAYPEVYKQSTKIGEVIAEEEARFRLTLARGLKEFERLAGRAISGHDAFILFSTYGFPLEMTKELATEKNIAVDEKGFKDEMRRHQELSRAGSEQKFRGGLADASEQALKYHTATHLLNAALKKVLGEHVKQKGSNITSERLRFDFSHGAKMTDEEKAAVEKFVNDAIKADYPVVRQDMPKSEAEKLGAEMEFGAKYPDTVSVYTIGPDDAPISREFCGGPHVTRTGELASTNSAQATPFKIIKEEASSAGVRRIKAILE